MKRLWIVFIAIFVFSFAILGWVGTEIFRQAPPIPREVVTTEGKVLIADGQVLDGQNVWQAMGGMQMGSIWGHGSYVAPDWTADYLHREATYILDSWANAEFSHPYSAINSEQQAVLRQRLQNTLRKNNYDTQTGKITVEPIRAEAFEENLKHYSDVFANGNKSYAIQRDAQSDPAKLRQLNSFFFWTSWASVTNRPNQTISYTSNFPPEPLVANVATSSSIVWTGVSVIMLLAGIGAMVWLLAGRKSEPEHDVPDSDPLLGVPLTPSQKATVKYFLVVTLLFLLQILMGVLTAHYGVEGGGFYGFPLADYLPYAVTRTWHTQLGIFWIATAWLASGLFIGPIICGYEPKRQKLGVDLLFGALLIVVLGSMAGQWLSIAHKLTGAASFYFGHQGYEYVDLGRVWQAALFVGLLLWLFLIARTAVPALRQNDNRKSLIVLYLITTAGIALFYSPGLFWGMRSHLSVVEYWRWWVVHLWVEGFFEVFATVVIAFLFSRLGVIKAERAAQASLLSGAVYLSGGIIGTLHHLYFAGTPTIALAFGSVFSALEIVPLTLVGFEVWENIHHTRVRPWLQQYKWVIYFFVAVAFWNLVGAGIFGFMINPPIALYYMQGLNTTAVHAHGALYGVYGTLGLGLTLFCLRAMKPQMIWKERVIKFAFWAINIGMLMEIVLSLLPIGLLQTYESVSVGYWSARSPEFMQTSLMHFLRWMRIVGDMVFAVGAVAFVYFALDLIFRRPKVEKKTVITAVPEIA
ncbi:MAG: nitric-oxide reductase large subunit [Acidobacteriota bacterium]|nr:nitric-oxide reductase large subunit [Acidobacteriota bacterium]